MNDNQDNNDRDCDGYHRPLTRTHREQLELVVVTVCRGLLLAVAGVLLLDTTGGAHAEVAVLTLGVLLAMLIQRLLKDDPNGDDDS